MAKRLPSVKYSLLQYSKIEHFSKQKVSKNLHTQENGPSGALKSHNAEKLKGGPFEVFHHPLSQNMKKLKKKQKFLFSGKNLTMPKKTEKGDPLVSPGMVCYAEKQEKLFWFSSLGQIVQFGAIIFCRTFKNYFGQFVWIEKKRVTIIFAFNFMSAG